MTPTRTSTPSQPYGGGRPSVPGSLCDGSTDRRT